MATAETPKYLAIARSIEAEILAGRFGGPKAPSSREVAERFDVSPVTASRALQVLRDKGLTRIVGRSGSYLTKPGPTTPVEERWALCLRVTPGRWYTASLSMTRSGFDAVAAATPGLKFDRSALGEVDACPLDELKRRAVAAAEAGIRGVFLLPTRHGDDAARRDEAILDACRSAGLAAVLIERNLRGHARPLEFDLVATDDLDGGLRGARHLLDRGRRRVAFVTGSPTSTHDGRLAGYLLALLISARESGSSADPIVLVEPAGVPSKAAYRQMADQILASRADGVLCYHDYVALGLIVELLSRGVRIPDDVAIAGFDDLPIGDSFALGVTTYAFPAEDVARQALRQIHRRLASPSDPPIRILVPGTLIARESTGPT